MVQTKGNARKGNRKSQRSNGQKKRDNRKVENPIMSDSHLMGVTSAQSNYRAMNESITVLRGSEFLSRLTVKAAPLTATARILGTYPVTPSAYSGTRLTQLSQLWERYRFREFSIRYVPSVPTTLAAQLISYIDTDPNDDPTIISDVDTLMRQATSQTGSQQWNFNRPKTINLAQRADDEWYYTGVDKENERFNRQGNAFLLQASNPMDFAGNALIADLECGSLYIDWVCEFQIPQIEPIASGN